MKSLIVPNSSSVVLRQLVVLRVGLVLVGEVQGVVLVGSWRLLRVEVVRHRLDGFARLTR